VQRSYLKGYYTCCNCGNTTRFPLVPVDRKLIETSDFDCVKRVCPKCVQRKPA